MRLRLCTVLLAGATLNLSGCALPRPAEFAWWFGSTPKASLIGYHAEMGPALANCRALAPVSATAHMHTPGVVAVLQTKLREAAFDAGADSVLALDISRARHEYTVQGTAYRCLDRPKD